MITVSEKYLIIDLENTIKQCYDFIQESVEFSKNCGEYDDTNADVDGFINSKLSEKDKIYIMTLFKKELMSKFEKDEDFFQNIVSKFIEDKYGLKTT